VSGGGVLLGKVAEMIQRQQEERSWQEEEREEGLWPARFCPEE